MENKINYRYPSKIKKFSINDPFLKILVTKYEKEIPWQTIVKNQDSLNKYVKETMLSSIYKYSKGDIYLSRKYFIDESVINLEQELNLNQIPDLVQLNNFKKMRVEKGDDSVKRLITTIKNNQKRFAFESWVKLMRKNYKKDPAFIYLMLKPMFEFSDDTTRKPLMAPESDVVDWIYSIILKEKLLPDVNIAKEYFKKIDKGISGNINNGWVYIPSDHKRLAAVCQGSGWCISDTKWASHYLEYNDFYILKSNGKPKVALRCSRDNNIIECQGISNTSPKEWFIEVDFFIRDNNLNLLDRKQEYEYALHEYSPNETPITWWNERIVYWPLAYFHAPENIRIQLNKPRIENLITNKNALSLPKIASYIPDIKVEQWLNFIKDNPAIYHHLPINIIKNDESAFREAFESGIYRKIEMNELTMDELKYIPEHFKEKQIYQDYIKYYFTGKFHKLIIKNPQKREERENRFEFNSLVPQQKNEDFEITQLRLLNILMNNETSDFSDNIFPLNLRKLKNFKELRESAWAEAVKVNPTFRFALPKDLRDKLVFGPQKEPAPELLDKWVRKVKYQPWLLTRKDFVPASVRYRDEILLAYADGWFPILYEKPYKLWIEKSSLSGCKRIYLAYPALRCSQIMNALIAGFRKSKGELRSYGTYSSNRTSCIAAIQLAVLLASVSYDSDLSKFMIERVKKYFYVSPYIKKPDTYDFFVNEILNGKLKEVCNKYNDVRGSSVFKMFDVKERLRKMNSGKKK